MNKKLRGFEERIYSAAKEAGTITYADLAKKVGYSFSGIGSAMSKIRKKGYDIDKYIERKQAKTKKIKKGLDKKTGYIKKRIELSETERRVYKTAKQCKPITYERLAQKIGINQDSLRSIVSNIRKNGYKIGSYIKKKSFFGDKKDIKELFRFACNRCNKKTTTTSLDTLKIGLCYQCRQENINAEEKTSEPIKEDAIKNVEIKEEKIIIGLEDGMELKIPIKKQMSAEEFLNISEKVKKIKGLDLIQKQVSLPITSIEDRPGWGEREIQYLISNYKKIPEYKIATKLGRTSDSVRMKARRLGLSSAKIGFKTTPLQKWTQKEVDFLKENAKDTSVSQLAEALNRKETSVCGKLYRLGLPAIRKKKVKERKGKIRIKRSDVLDVIKKMNSKNLYPTSRNIRIEMGLPKKRIHSLCTHIWALENQHKKIKRKDGGYVSIEPIKAEEMKGPLEFVVADEKKQQEIKYLLQDCIDGKKITFKDARAIGAASTPEEWQIYSKKITENEDKICDMFNVKGKFVFTPDFYLIFEQSMPLVK